MLPNWPHPNTAWHLQQSDTWLSQNYRSCWWEKPYSDAAPQAGTFSRSRITQTQHKLMPSTSPVPLNTWGQPNCTDQTHEFTSAPHCPWTRWWGLKLQTVQVTEHISSFHLSWWLFALPSANYCKDLLVKSEKSMNIMSIFTYTLHNSQGSAACLVNSTKWSTSWANPSHFPGSKYQFHQCCTTVEAQSLHCWVKNKHTV